MGKTFVAMESKVYSSGMEPISENLMQNTNEELEEKISKRVLKILLESM